MKAFKRLCTAILAAVICLSVAGCHKKDEIAVTVGDVKFTSAYYMCALLYADMEARSIVEENLDEDESTDKINYYAHKVEDTDYVKWVKNKAVDNLKKIAAYKILCKENKLELDNDIVSNADSYASFYWSNYGYSAYFEPNGVSLATFTQYMKDGYYSARYFEYLYGKGGSKEIAADTVKAKTLENFVLVNMINVDFSGKEEEEINSLKEKFNGYLASLQNGSMTFEQVYVDYNGEDSSAEETETEDSEELKPVDKRATVLGAEDTGYDSEQYETAKAMAVGEVKLVELEDNAGLVLLVKKDFEADPYYLENLDMSARHLIADDEFEKEINEYVKKMDFNISKYATDRFKVKKIKVPTASQ